MKSRSNGVTRDGSTLCGQAGSRVQAGSLDLMQIHLLLNVHHSEELEFI